MARRIKGGVKRRQIQPVVSSLSVLHSPEHTRDSPNCVEKKMGRGEIEVTCSRNRRVKRGREQSGQ